jgi:hypothetical protein
MIDIPVPPSPQMPEALAAYPLYVAGAVVLVGIVMLLWGRRVGRFFIMFVGAGVGYLAGEPLATMIGASPALGQVVLAISLAIVFFIAARLIWALVIGSLFEAIALGLLLWHFVPLLPAQQAPKFAAAGDFVAWATALAKFSWDSVEAVRQANFGTLMLVIVPAGLLPMMIALLKGRGSVIFMSGLLGGMIATAALWLAAVGIRSSIWPADWIRFLIPLGVALVLTIIGWVYQAHGELADIRARQKAAKPEEEPKKDEDKVYLPKASEKSRKGK